MVGILKREAKNRQRMSVRNKFVVKYDTDIDTYLQDEEIETFGDSLAGILEFMFNSILPIALVGILSSILSVVLGSVYNSAVFGMCFFIATIPIFILGVGSISLSYAVKKLVSGIFFIIEFTINKSNLIYNDLIKAQKKNVKITEVVEIVIYTLIIPSGKKVLEENIFTFIPYFFVKKIMKWVAKRVCIENEKELALVKSVDATQSIFWEKFNRRYKKIHLVVKVLMYTLMVIVILIGILASLIGILFLIGIFTEPSVRETSNVGGLIELVTKAIAKLGDI